MSAWVFSATYLQHRDMPLVHSVLSLFISKTKKKGRKEGTKWPWRTVFFTNNNLFSIQKKTKKLTNTQYVVVLSYRKGLIWECKKKNCKENLIRFPFWRSMFICMRKSTLETLSFNWFSFSSNTNWYRTISDLLFATKFWWFCVRMFRFYVANIITNPVFPFICAFPLADLCFFLVLERVYALHQTIAQNKCKIPQQR